ncbi:hypothetical protein ACR42D_15005 [Desulfovibrio caledoniensis]
MQKKTKDFSQDIDNAMKRAALRAREIAVQTNTPIVIEVDGKVKAVRVTPSDVEQYRELIKDAL